MSDRRPRRRSPKHYPIKDLSYIVTQGGRTRRHKYFREMGEFTFPIVAAIVLQAVVYILIITRPGRSDWNNILQALVAISCVPLISGAVLAGLRRNGAAIMTATLVTVGLFSVAVSVLSGMRIPVSYQALAACLPIAVVIIAFANIRFQRSFAAQVAIANFPGAEDISRELGTVPILKDPAAKVPDIEILLIDPGQHHSARWSALLTSCYLRGIEIMPWTGYREVRTGRLDVSSFEVSHLAYSPSQFIYSKVKRVFDLLAVLVSLPITLPIAALVAVYIAILDGFPVIFVQIRRGYGGRRFRMYKFRTMYKGAEGGSTGPRDKRILPGCRLIRKLRIDELPQLYNILRGDMSLIGPRPVAEYVARNSAAVEPKYELRSLVLPGITGWAQVKSGYAGTVEEELYKLSYDLYYIKHLSFDLDLLIFFKTIRTVLFGSGAR
jgi:UDP-GalNAc:undecaprenyl-phosphate GalNAc-1-phosphate transferase